MDLPRRSSGSRQSARSPASAVAAIVAAALMWSTMGLFVRGLSRFALSAMEIVALRSAVTVLFLFAFVVVRSPQSLRIRARDAWCFLGTGIASMLFFNYCYFLTITLTSLSVAAVLLYTAPAFVMLLSVLLFRERPTVLKLVALALAFAGCVLITGSGGRDAVRLNLQGVLTGLGAGFGYALYSIFGRYAIRRGYSTITITSYTFLFAAAGAVLLVDASDLGRAVVSDAALGGWVVAMAICTTVVPYLLYTSGLRYVESSRAAIIASVEPVGATLIGALWFGESPTATGVAGMAFVIGSVALLGRDAAEGRDRLGIGP